MTGSGSESKKIFKVGDMEVRVRSEPGLQGATVRYLPVGHLLETELTSRTEADGYVWWQHAEGWSAERSMDGAQVFLVEQKQAVSAPAKPKSAPTSPPPPTKEKLSVKKKVFQVGSVPVRVRDAPGLQGDSVKYISSGQSLEVDPDSRTEADGYVWWQHAEGWSAERSADGKEIYLFQPSQVVSAPAKPSEPAKPGAPAVGTPSAIESLPAGEVLPLRDQLFKKMPVTLDQVQWWQYFGNNVFAFNLWREGKRWYSYAQGLHAGLDFGNSSARGVQVRAGLEGTFTKIDTSAYRPHAVWVKVSDYDIIYGHLVNPGSFQAGQPIGVDTVVGELEFGGQQHLHLEVRYKTSWIVNPLLFMPEEMRGALFQKFPPGGEYFYRGGGFDKWQTPLDQPALKLGGGLIGPHAMM